jgi:hypothetical protein
MQAHGPLGVMLVAITALPVIQSVSAAELQPATVYKLFKQCEIEKPQNTDEVASLVECREYIHGMVDILSVNGRVRERKSPFLRYAMCQMTYLWMLLFGYLEIGQKNIRRDGESIE